MYPEWIQEQIDKYGPKSSSYNRGGDPRDRLIIQLASIESRIIHYIGFRLDRIEAKLDVLIAALAKEA